MPGKTETQRKLVIAITSGAVSTPLEPRGTVFVVGQIFDAADPIVKAAPLYFMPTDSTSEEIQAAKNRFAPVGLQDPAR